MEEVPTPPITPTGRQSLWKYLLFTFLGTTLSIILTFGTGYVMQEYHKRQSRKMTALMVMGNIEKFAQTMDDAVLELERRDTMAAYLLRIPVDSLDSPDYAFMVEHKIPYMPYKNHDKQAETIFSNTIGTWRSKDDFAFINMVGICFSAITTIEGIYDRYRAETIAPEDRIMANPNDFFGQSLNTKLLRDEEYRRMLKGLHKEADYFRYLADKVRTLNAINMSIMKVTEEEVLLYAKDNEAYTNANKTVKKLKDFQTPAIDFDDLPDFETWANQQ